MALSLALLIPAASGAAPLPDTNKDTIVPNLSIGGVHTSLEWDVCHYQDCW